MTAASDPAREEVLAALACRGSERLDALRRLGDARDAAPGWLADVEIRRAVVAALGSESRSEQRAAAEAIAPLVAASPELRAALEAALAASAQRLRWGAAYTLGRALPPRADLWPAAREAMALEDGDQRWAAAELACGLARAHPAVFAELCASLGAEPAVLRKMVLYCLRDVGLPDGLRLAGGLLADPDSGVRLAALATTVRIPAGGADAGAAAERIAAMVRSDPDPGVRRAAAAALGRLGVAGDAVVTALEEACRADDASLARAARASLQAVGGRGT